MNNIKPIFKREFVSFFNSPIAYIFVAVFLVVTNWLFFTRFFLTGQANMREWFGLVPWLFLLLAPAITMRSWAEEKKSGTVEFLLTLPIRDWEVVIAKFLSSLSFLAVVLIFSLTIPITIGKLGDIDFGVIISGYVGAILMGAMYLSLGLLISSFTKNQIVSFLISLSVLFAIFIIGSNNVMSFLQGPLASIMQFLSSATHFNSIVKGIFDSRDIIYYLSFTALFIYLNIQTIGSRNWR
ncbi:MAG: ABC transporter [Parcubacteria group bacterium CG_4_9_14_0_2_um_filter_41_8]|nr:MAG: ABC transporter [Parcubacteria group bacterium CG22_combo_CG10-13_8_21_14_all_41_9]PIQ80446.1 MAG: ABC transporter [Parcubacteria group bacterium CG11_big_fil_rev_8_21_14_0_20_41_14]PJC40373.1 MAG: ABC transporter [Parcubacteria group bacterium CG_4_9_14_0_2_um_filter_41_8]